MNRILSRSFPLFFVVPMFLMTGCHLMFGPPTPWGGACWDECWTWCDHHGCKTCDKEGCDVPNSQCDPAGPKDQCPGTSKCDPDRAVCKKKDSCSTKADCSGDDLCIGGACVPQRDPCKNNDGCGKGAYCKNGVCAGTKTCKGDGDCKALGAFVCDLRGTCVPGVPAKPKGCSVANACPGGVCVNSKCGTCTGDCGGGKTCQFNSQCGDGRACLDGQCVNKCKKTDQCGSGQVCNGGVCAARTGVNCTYNKDCGAGMLCVNSQCVQNCTGNKCDNTNDLCGAPIKQGKDLVRACHANHKPKLECKVSKDCTNNETCVNGVCRTVCTSDNDCVGCNDGHKCGPGGFCMTTQEATPMCSTNKDSKSGQACLNARCQKL